MKKHEPTLERNVLRIRQLNDALRRTFRGGRIVITASISAWPEHVQCELFRQIQQFDSFDESMDPRGERDLISLNFDWGGYKEHIFAKVDYYDEELRFGSPDPSDPTKTTRVLSILKASEW